MLKYLTIISLLCSISVFSQGQTKPFLGKALQDPYHLFVNDQKTSVIIFPAPIAANGVDRGSSDVLAKTVGGVENILKVKGALSSFNQTNLTVVTTDGKVYAFIVDYSATPDERPIDMSKQLAQEASIALFKERKLNDTQIETISKTLVKSRAFMNRPKAHSYKMKAALHGIYTVDDVIFYRIFLNNQSPIDYDLDFLRFFVKDRKRMKRTAEQEKEMQPLFVYKELGNTLSAHTKQTFIVAFPKFTIADRKNFVMQVFERNGDRNLQLKINGRDIIKAQQLSFSAK